MTCLKKTIRVFLRVLAYLFPEPHSRMLVLCYHDIGDGDSEWTVTLAKFFRHVDLIQKSGARIVPLSYILAVLQGERGKPQGVVVAITLDDGLLDLMRKNLSVITMKQIPVTLFLVGDTNTAHGLIGPAISLGEARREHRSVLVTYGYHGATHTLLDSVPPGVLVREVERPKGMRWFAYPGGHHTAQVRKAVQDAGYEAAFSITPEAVKDSTDPYKIPRFVVHKGTTDKEIVFLLSRAQDWFSFVRGLYYRTYGR